MKKLVRFLVSTKKELKKVRWPNKKEMLTYSIATIAIVLIFGVFFTATDLLVAGITKLVG